MAPLLQRPRSADFKILALSGGGFLGLYTAQVLALLEEEAGQPLGRCFDLLAGTSIGGLLALALAYEVPMRRMVDLFVQRGAEVFSDRALPGGAVSRLVDLTRSVMGPKYTGKALRKALEDELGEVHLKDALHPAVVTAVDVQNCQTKVFKTPHAAASKGDGPLRASEVALASCAAPAYFPSVKLADRLFADGGLVAVAPDQVALHEAEHFMGVDLASVSMLSIGTATAHYHPRDGVDDDAGAVGWLSDGRLILTLISAQQQHVQAMVEDRLGDRYLRLDADWPADAGLGIDVATPAAAKVLRELAHRTMAVTPRRAFDPWLGTEPPRRA